jgi:hypothetical protein
MHPDSRARLLAAVRPVLPDIAAILAAALFFALRPSPAWIAGPYAQRFYSPLQRAVTGATNLIPFAAGDVLVALVVGGLLLYWFHRLQVRFTWLTLGLLVVRTLAVASLLYIWFLVAWGWNYDEPALYIPLHYDSHAVDRISVDRVEDDMVDALNALAPTAHALHERAPVPQNALEEAYRSALALLRIDPGVLVTVPKRTLMDPYFVATGVAGMFFPFTFETYLASDVLWYEYPFNLAHEWGHVAGISRESDANFEGALTTLRSAEPELRYSGLIVVYGAMPRIGKHDRRLSKLVLADYAAMHDRNERHIKPIAFKFAWGTYDKYLKSQHVTTGVINYTEYIQLMLGTQAGRDAISTATGRPITLR